MAYQYEKMLTSLAREKFINKRQPHYFFRHFFSYLVFSFNH